MSQSIIIIDAGLLARSQDPEGPATGHLGTSFSWFPCGYKRMLRWFPSFQVAAICLSCGPPDLNSLVTFFSIFVYMENNHCHRVTTQLQLINIIITTLSVTQQCYYGKFMSPAKMRINDDIFVNCNWVVTRWQKYSTHLHTNNTYTDTKQKIHWTT